PESFDAAIARLALMLIPERGTALAGIRRALKPGKKFAALVIATAAQSPFLALPLAIARRHAGLPPVPFEDPGMFALGEPAVLRAAYERAGFREVAIEVVAAERRFPSLAVAMQNCRDVLPEISPLLAPLSAAARDAAWAEIEGAMRQFDRTDGFVV